MTRARWACVILLVTSAPASAASSPLGLWTRGDGKALVRIEKCGSALCAINTWIRPGTPDEKVGDKLVLNVEPAGAGTMTGKAWDPQRKASFNIEIEARESDMTTRGCVVAGLLCKDMHWTRESAARNELAAGGEKQGK